MKLFRNFLVFSLILFLSVSFVLIAQEKISIRASGTIVRSDTTIIEAQSFEENFESPKQEVSDTITITGVGDIMLGTSYPSKSYLPPNNDWSFLMKDVKHILKRADATFGNLEGAFSDDAPVTKRCNDPSVCYAFRTPESYFKCIVEAGFDLLSLANNHSADLGLRGLKSTIKLINDANLNYAGILSHPTCVYETKGVKIGLCAFSPNTGNSDIRNIPVAQKIVKKLQTQCDIVVVSFHGGAEGSRYQHVPRKTETFYGENRGNVYDFAHKMIDAGADVIFGHGPHVTRAIDVYKDRFIIYSMGNFCTYSRMNISGVSGLAPIMEVKVDKKGKFLKGQIHAVKQISRKGTKIDSQKKIIAKIKELTKADFPELKINISNDGIVTKP